MGNLRGIVDNRDPNNPQSFTYDALDRLTSATGAYGSHSYSYNAMGNILSKAGVSYTYGQTAQTCGRLMPHAVTSTSDGKSYTYDCNGNMLSDGERTLTWDADNKPVSITRAGVGTTTFAYTGHGTRVKKDGSTRIIRYVGPFEDHVTDGVQVKHIMVGPLRIATRVNGGPNAGTYFPHGDHLGSLNVFTSNSGIEVQRLTYLPYGETYTNAGSVDFHQRRYTGQEQDPETGLYFYHARYYHNVLGRFVSADTIVPNPVEPQALNRYAYVQNNPLRWTDPSGHFLDFLIAAFVSALVGAAVGSTVAAATGGDAGRGALAGGLFGLIMGPVGVGAGALSSAGYDLAAGGLWAVGGAAAGAASSAAIGGNPGSGAAYGAGFAVASWLVPTSGFEP